MGGTLSAATRTVPNSKRAITFPPQMVARPKSYIRKQATAKFKRRARNGATCAHSWRANVALGVRLDSDLAALGSDFGRNVTLNRFQTRGCCAKHACCITLQHHDRPESW